MSLPSWERGLKSHISLTGEAKSGSLPSWERGLKSKFWCGNYIPEEVAPLVGAWIEISSGNRYPIGVPSLPSWERGLKCSSIVF